MKRNLLFGILSILIFCALLRDVHAQQESVLHFDGLVHGYELDPARGFLKKKRPFIFEGLLDSVRIQIYQNDQKKRSTATDKFGKFSLTLGLDSLYKLEVSKPGYNKNVLFIDTRAIPQEIRAHGIRFSGVEFILNSFKDGDDELLNETIGRLYYNSNTGYFDFDVVDARKPKTGIFKVQEHDNLVFLMKRAIARNKDSFIIPFAPSLNLLPKTKAKPKMQLSEVVSADSIEITTVTIHSDFMLSPTVGLENLKDHEISAREKEVQTARFRLEVDKLISSTPQDSILIQERETQIRSAEVEIENARRLIDLQRSEIAAQQQSLQLLIGSLILLLILLVIGYKYYRQKSKTHILLARKNKKIIESINYAKRIQQAILVKERQIQKHLPRSFVYYQPKDIVSGDFYWFTQLDGKTVLAAIDCTGHGVPGAFMSLIGNTLLNEIINEKKITDPALILDGLHTRVIEALHQQEYSQTYDGMEMALCVLHQESRLLEYAGAMNSLYMVLDGVVEVVRGDFKSIGGNSLNNGQAKYTPFTNHKIQLQENAAFYLFTDGYLDQFGGAENRKFNTSRFKTLLLNIQKMRMEKQKEFIHETIQEWKGKTPQLDDILVIGVKP